MLRRVTFEVDLSAFRDETLAAFLATTTKNVAAGFGGHACTETVLLFPGAFGWLIRTFAHGFGLGKGSGSVRWTARGANSMCQQPLVNPPVTRNFKIFPIFREFLEIG